MSPFVLPMFELHAYLWAFPDEPVERVLILFNRPKTLQEQPLLWNSMLLGRPKTGGTQQLNKLIFSDQSSRRLEFSLHHPVFTIRPLFGQCKLYCILPELEIRSYDERPHLPFQSLLQIWYLNIYGSISNVSNPPSGGASLWTFRKMSIRTKSI